ncbi:MAG: YodL domain-containing protein, partial [Coprococcus comes]
HYENGYSNIGEFIEAHDDRLPPELIEEARAAAYAAGLPFSEKTYQDGEEPDPYLFDGSMSMEDYALMHRMIEKERSERMEQPILSGYLSNLGKYTEGRPAGEWVSFPTTAEHLKEVFDRIGIDGKNYGELHITEYQSSIAGLAGKLTELESLDELNYLSELLKMQFDDDREKFVAAMEYGDHTRDLQDIINLAQNLDCYWLYPSVQSEEDYGHYLIEELDELELPEEAKKYFMYEEYGRDAATGEKPTELQRAHIRQQKVAAQEQPAQEQPEQEAPQDKDTFSIYQIKGGDETRDLRFEPYDRLIAAGHRVDAKNYTLVYSAPLTPGTSLEDIYTRFNIDHPKDFKGHSLSVSDVVVLHQNGQDTAHYVDSFGYKKVPEFLQPENYLKTAEQTTEQNYNMIDGQINNTPTVAELEAKVKTGETISLVDLAETVKADKERGKAAKTEKKPSIRAQLKAAKEQTPKKQAKQKTQDLERS